ncbi:preprotein translocase subunit YajC [Aquisalimonas sp. 2447]|uniref:preprotein translocase subunit YajC n=1 Tax=Aquisalimonas sp. 2447 TaxID=2740807 RepID=UPI001580D1B7|nr:preprotein translocase subunit YajC [Aquisalimonas sp. 2447]
MELLDFFISSAHAQQGEGAGWTALLFPIALIAIFYFLLIRPQAKRAKEHKKLVSELAKGDEVITQGGLLGRITEVDETFITMEINDNNQVKVQKNAVSQVVPKGTIKGKADPGEAKKASK